MFLLQTHYSIPCYAGKLILTTVAENACMLKKLLGVTPQKFKPVIPNLIYQYDLYTNYESLRFSATNHELPDD